MAWSISTRRAGRAPSSRNRPSRRRISPSPGFLDGTAPRRAAEVRPSDRGELEITTLLESYLHDGQLSVEKMGRGFAWLDTGTHASLLDAGNFVRTLENRQGLQTGCPEEIAFQAGWISADELRARAGQCAKNAYGRYLLRLLGEAE